jgi:hypothetical protein
VWSAVGVHDGVHDVVRVIREASPGARPEQVWADIKGEVAALENEVSRCNVNPILHSWLGIVVLHVMLLGMLINLTKLLFQIGEGNAAIQSGIGLPVVGVGAV